MRRQCETFELAGFLLNILLFEKGDGLQKQLLDVTVKVQKNNSHFVLFINIFATLCYQCTVFHIIILHIFQTFPVFSYRQYIAPLQHNLQFIAVINPAHPLVYSFKENCISVYSLFSRCYNFIGLIRYFSGSNHSSGSFESLSRSICSSCFCTLTVLQHLSLSRNKVKAPAVENWPQEWSITLLSTNKASQNETSNSTLHTDAFSCFLRFAKDIKAL